MTDKMLFSLSIFLTGQGSGIALVTFVAPRSRAAGLHIKPAEQLLKVKTSSP
jgi:hypothetical protein